MKDATQLLLAWQAGEPSALERLTPLVYDELRRIAGSMFKRERPNHTLQPTALVNEAFLKLVGGAEVSWQSRAHFLAVAASCMRRILVDHSRAKNAVRRGGAAVHLPIAEELVSTEQAPEILAVDEALADLVAFDKRRAQIIELRYFGGLTAEEIAEAIGVSTATVTRDLRVAEAWLANAIKERKGRRA
jgi:RNA polymerase sigma factor (TIGR02999 family)